MREAAEHHGVDLADHGPLQTAAEADDRYAAAVGDWLISPPRIGGMRAGDGALRRRPRRPIGG
jgi:hypothetical protein